MIDLIFAVHDPVAWHAANLRQFPTHYSGLRWLGPRAVAAVQDWGAGVYFNTLVPLLDCQIKYGVVSVRRLEHDLRTWDTLYLSGRLHKPVTVLRDLPSIRSALDANRASALVTALLLLPERFTTAELLNTIVALSYTGDVRMGVGENPHKVANIVAGQHDELVELYVPRLSALPHVAAVAAASEGRWQQQRSVEVLQAQLRQLPDGLAVRVRRRAGHPQAPNLDFLAHDAAIASQHLRGALAETVAASSLVQSLKGVLTAGVRKSVVYMAEKLKKRQAGLRQGPPSK